MQPAALAAWWAHRQGLLQEPGNEPPAEVLADRGWARSVGGSNPYLALFARARTSRLETDTANDLSLIGELPSARGCTYVVPRSHFALALKVGASFGEGEARLARSLGVEEDEIGRLCSAVLEVLSGGPLEPADIRTSVGDACRTLGEEGRKKGLTTTLPVALGRLQTAGQIRRLPVNGRLDQQRYRYCLWPENPLRDCSLSSEDAFVELARLYFGWIEPASIAHFAWFSGLGSRAADRAVAPLGLIPAWEGSELLISPKGLDELRAFKPPSEPIVRLVASIDGLFLLRRDIQTLFDPRHSALEIAGEKGCIAPGSGKDLPSNAIVDRGMVVGLWEYDVESAAIVWWSFVGRTEAIQGAVRETERFVRDELGDARSFSLDSPASRKPLVAALRAAAG